jgi:hypothetical protein
VLAALILSINFLFLIYILRELVVSFYKAALQELDKDGDGRVSRQEISDYLKLKFGWFSKVVAFLMSIFMFRRVASEAPAAVHPVSQDELDRAEGHEKLKAVENEDVENDDKVKDKQGLSRNQTIIARADTTLPRKPARDPGMQASTNGAVLDRFLKAHKVRRRALGRMLTMDRPSRAVMHPGNQAADLGGTSTTLRHASVGAYSAFAQNLNGSNISPQRMQGSNYSPAASPALRARTKPRARSGEGYAVGENANAPLSWTSPPHLDACGETRASIVQSPHSPTLSATPNPSPSSSGPMNRSHLGHMA